MSAPNASEGGSPIVNRATRSGVRKVKYREEGRAGRSQVSREGKRAKLDSEDNGMPRTRRQIMEVEALKPRPIECYNIAKSPEEAMKRRTRSQKPRCLDFGPYRHIKYEKGENFFFCHGCDLLGKRLPDDKRGVDAKTFACTAKHMSFLFPTDRRTRHYTLAYRAKKIEQSGGMVAAKQMLVDSEDEASVNTLIDYEESDDESGDEHPRTNEETPTVDELVVDKDTVIGIETTPPSPLEPRVLDGQLRAEPAAAVAALHDGNADQFITPTTNGNNKEVTAPEDDSMANDIASLSDELVQSRALNTSLQACNRKLRDSNCYMARKMGLSMKATSTINGEADNTTDTTTERIKRRQQHLKHAIESSVGKCRRGQERARAILIARTVWELYNGDVREQLLVLAKAHFRKTMFTPYNILKQMDLHGGTLSYAGVETLREIEKQGRKYVRKTMIPSSADLKRAAKRVEVYAKAIAGDISHSYDPHLQEVLSFEYDKVIPAVYEAFGLYHTAQNRMTSIARSIDGTSFSHNHHAVVAGAKIQDPGALCPLTNKLILDGGKDLAAQSRNLVIPLKITKCRETKESLKAFDDMFEFFDSCQFEGEDINPLAKEPHRFKPFLVATNVDMAAAQKGLHKGGGMKTKEYACHCCAIRVNDIAMPNVEQCSTFCRQLHSDNPDWRCYHHDIVNAEKLREMEQLVNQMTASLTKDTDFVNSFSKMEKQDVLERTLHSRDNPNSIHYHYTGPKDDGSMSQNDQQYLTNVLSELRLRGISIEGGRVVRHDRLRKALESEFRLKELLAKMRQMRPDENAVFVIMSTVPCILHAENRMGLKLITMLLMSGLANAGDGTILKDEERADRKRQYLFIKKAEDIVNTKILGDERDRAWWMLPCEKGPNGVMSIGTITLDNNKTRAITTKLNLLIDLCLPGVSNERCLWERCWTHYCRAVILLRQKNDFSDDDIAEFQLEADKFFLPWVKLCGSEGITNYIHMLGAGHFAEYLHKWKNLHRHSQQGWEAFNALLKTFYYRRTQRGGGRYGKSVLLPIGRWLHRRIVWLNNIRDHVIEEHYEETLKTARQQELPLAEESDSEDDSTSGFL